MTVTIRPHLWFEREALDAARTYTALLPDSGIDHVTTLHGTPSGSVEVVDFHLGGQPFQAISAGPHDRFNPSISFMCTFDPARDPAARDHLDAAWDTLAAGGTSLMPLDAYPFSRRFGWVQDRYGLSWQLILTDPGGDPRPPVLSSLLFSGEVCGRAEEAGVFWRSVFPDSRAGLLVRHPPGAESDREGTVLFSDFRLAGTWFTAADSGYDHGFGFNEAVSFVVSCDTQAEIDRYWEALSAVPEAEACGWCRDRFGVSWQVVPRALDDMLRDPDPARVDRVKDAFLPMRKLDLATLRAAFDAPT